MRLWDKVPEMALVKVVNAFEFFLGTAKFCFKGIVSFCTFATYCIEMLVIMAALHSGYPTKVIDRLSPFNYLLKLCMFIIVD